MRETTSLVAFVRGARAGDAPDLDGLLSKLRPLIIRWAVVWTGSPDVAEDVAQTVLLRFDGAVASLAPETRVTTWLYRVTRNVLIDHDRARGRDEELRDLLGLEQIARAVAEENDAQSFEAVDLLKRFMQVLSPQQRAALDLIDLQGFSAEDAAEMLEVATPTVRVHLHRARQALRAHIEQEAPVEGTHD